MPDLRSQIEDPQLTPFQRLVLLFQILRSPEGCAWDRKQTHRSLVPYLIEESYEVVEAIQNGTPDELCEELGDLLTQVIFHAQLAREAGEFSIDDVITGVVTKLVNRHPHVFGEKKELNPQQVRDQWEKIKTTSGEKESVLSGLPKTMPALTMAFRIGEKAGGVGFDWHNPADVVAKIDEELQEMKMEMHEAQPSREKLEEEIGDLLFATASLARKLEIDPEVALRQALTKFRSRFDRLEERVRKSGKNFDNFSLDQLEEFWQALKADQSS